MRLLTIRRGVGTWTLLLLVAWAAGLAQSVALTTAATGRGDVFAEVEAYAPLHGILGTALRAGYRTDYTFAASQTSRWRLQYAALPTMLRLTASDRAALQMAREGVRAAGTFHLVYQFRRSASRARFGARVQGLADEIGCRLQAHDVTAGTVVYELRDCARD